MEMVRDYSIEATFGDLKSEGVTLPTNSEHIKTKSHVDNPEIIAIIDSRRLERECFVRSVELLHPRLVIIGVASATECVDMAADGLIPSAIILNIGRFKLSDPQVSSQLTLLLDRTDTIPVVVLAECEDLDEIIAALDLGASGFVSVSIGVEGIVEATKLASAGGVFLSLDNLSKLRNSVGQTNNAPPNFRDLTKRQTMVAEALRRGKANKTIAYELNMCESTVKVHIRTIMRKLKATNRTEAAFKLNSILPQESADV